MTEAFPSIKAIRLTGVVLGSALLGACSANLTTFSQPFGNPQPPGRVNSTTVSIPGQQPLPVVTQAPGDKPTVVINAPASRVQETIIARARSRGTTVVGANQTGVTLERALPSSTQVIEAECGPHQPGRTVRIYLATQGSGPQTVVTEDRFIIDQNSRVCAWGLLPGDVEQANQALTELKSQSEARRTAQAAPRASGAVQPVVPGRPVVPLR